LALLPIVDTPQIANRMRHQVTILQPRRNLVHDIKMRMLSNSLA
jgi:hypothetical protein